MPHRAFNRRIGEFSNLHVDLEGNLLDVATWKERSKDWLPSEADEAYIASLMKPVFQPGKYANWIAPPKQGPV